jgi:type IV pilus assembly protein PilQ
VVKPSWSGRIVACLVVGLATATMLLTPLPAAGQADRPRGATRRMSASWTAAPLADVLRAFAAFSGASIVAGAGVGGFVTADINDQPWDVALHAVLSTRGLVATEDEHGIIRVESVADLGAREAVEPLLTRTYRISYSRAAEIQTAVAPLLSPRGSVSVVPSTNTVVVTDVARVQRAVASLLR